MLARQIKDLAIALEALTRVPKSDNFMEAIDDLLVRSIDKLREEMREAEQYKPKPNQTQDDEIPF